MQWREKNRNSVYNFIKTYQRCEVYIHYVYILYILWCFCKKFEIYMLRYHLNNSNHNGRETRVTSRAAFAIIYVYICKCEFVNRLLFSFSSFPLLLDIFKIPRLKIHQSRWRRLREWTGRRRTPHTYNTLR